MEHPQLSVLQRENFKWSLSNFTMLEAFLSVLDGDPLQEVVKSVIHQYKSSVVPKRSGFRKCECDICSLDFLLNTFDFPVGHTLYYHYCH